MVLSCLRGWFHKGITLFWCDGQVLKRPNFSILYSTWTEISGSTRKAGASEDLWKYYFILLSWDTRRGSFIWIWYFLSIWKNNHQNMKWKKPFTYKLHHLLKYFLPQLLFHWGEHNIEDIISCKHRRCSLKICEIVLLGF